LIAKNLMFTRHFLIASLLLAGALTPALALGQTSDADKATARDLTIEGYKALESGSYAAAFDRFTRADALYHAPSVILGLARAQVGLGKLVSAQELYSRAAHETLLPSASSASKKAVRDAQKELDALAPRIPSVIITVTGSDAARVTLDGAEVRSAALGVRRPVDPGKHVISGSAAGLATSEVTVILAEGKSESVILNLEPPRAAPPAPVVAVAPAAPAANHQTAVPGPPPPTPTITSAAPVAPEPDHVATPGSRRKTLGFVALGVGGAGLLVGGITGGLALGKHGDIAKSCPDGHCPKGTEASFQSAIDGYGTMGTLSTIGFIAGGALAATGVILIITAPRAKTMQASLAPVVGPGYLGARGSF
jgi:hypothetical protein